MDKSYKAFVNATGAVVYKYTPICACGVPVKKYKQIKHYQRAKTRGAFGKKRK